MSLSLDYNEAILTMVIVLKGFPWLSFQDYDRLLIVVYCTFITAVHGKYLHILFEVDRCTTICRAEIAYVTLMISYSNTCLIHTADIFMHIYITYWYFAQSMRFEREVKLVISFVLPLHSQKCDVHSLTHWTTRAHTNSRVLEEY